MPQAKYLRKESSDPSERCWNTVSHERKIELRRIAKERLAAAPAVTRETEFRLPAMTVPLELYSWIRAEVTRTDLTTRQVVLACIWAAAEGRPYAPGRGMTPAERKFLDLELRRQKKFAAAAAAKTREKNDSNIP